MNKITEIANDLADDIIDKYLDVTDFSVEIDDFDDLTKSEIDQLIAETSARLAVLIREQIDASIED